MKKQAEVVSAFQPLWTYGPFYENVTTHEPLPIK